MVVLGCLSWKIQCMLVHAVVSVLNCTFNIQVCNHSESWLFKRNDIWNLKCFVIYPEKNGPFDCSINHKSITSFFFQKQHHHEYPQPSGITPVPWYHPGLPYAQHGGTHLASINEAALCGGTHTTNAQLKHGTHMWPQFSPANQGGAMVWWPNPHHVITLP